MLYHIRPRLFTPHQGVKLISLEIEPFGLTLYGDVDLMTGCPGKNRNFHVACRWNGDGNALDGIFIETEAMFPEFSYTASWLVVYGIPMTHRVHCRVLDKKFDAVTEDSLLWHGTERWMDRRPGHWLERDSSHREPAMEVESAKRARARDEVYAEVRWIKERIEHFDVPTIEKDRLLDPVYARRRGSALPSLDSAFRPGEVPDRSGTGECMLCGRPARSGCLFHDAAELVP
jgi:hypothetical protein